MGQQKCKTAVDYHVVTYDTDFIIPGSFMPAIAEMQMQPPPGALSSHPSSLYFHPDFCIVIRLPHIQESRTDPQIWMSSRHP
jgi:hypothetical protein